jgi:YHS domain-containing protein
MARWSSVFVLTLLSLAVGGANLSNVNKEGVILDGYDVVSYFKPSGPQKGQAQFQFKYEDATYWFASAANKEEFARDPKKYAPQFGGWCAYAVASSKSKVEVDPKSFLIQGGRLLLFYNGIWADTRKKWLHTDSKDSQQFLREADANWPIVKDKDP